MKTQPLVIEDWDGALRIPDRLDELVGRWDTFGKDLSDD